MLPIACRLELVDPEDRYIAEELVALWHGKPTQVSPPRPLPHYPFHAPIREHVRYLHISAPHALSWLRISQPNYSLETLTMKPIPYSQWRATKLDGVPFVLKDTHRYRERPPPLFVTPFKDPITFCCSEGHENILCRYN